MNANKPNKPNKLMRGVALALVFSAFSTMASAEQGLNASSQTKVNNAKAKAWSNSDGNAKDPALEKRVVNMGSKRDGTCSVNVGTAKAGEKAPKEIVVTTKEVINICK